MQPVRLWLTMARLSDGSDMEDWQGYLLLFLVGCISGTLNVIAGGGSFLTLPMLIFLGLPPSVANATNRVGIVMQNIGAVWGFSRHRLVEWRDLVWAGLPATAGSVLGTWAALWVSDDAFRRILAFLMVAVTLWTLLNPVTGKPGEGPVSLTPSRRLLVGTLFFLIGIYGGFVQAGAGFFILAATTLAGLDLVRGNAVKTTTVLSLTVLSLSIFASQGRIHWGAGLLMGSGMVLGALVGVRLTVLRGHGWIKAVVTTAIIVFAVKLGFFG